MKSESILLQTVARLTFYLMMILSFFLYWRGHNDPGGGFVAGLLASGAIVLQMLAFGIEQVKKLLPFNSILVLASGLAIALLTGLTAMIFHYPFMTSALFVRDLPLVGSFEISSAAIFDLGVYLTVVGATISIIFAIGED